MHWGLREVWLQGGDLEEEGDSQAAPAERNPGDGRGFPRAATGRSLGGRSPGERRGPRGLEGQAHVGQWASHQGCRGHSSRRAPRWRWIRWGAREPAGRRRGRVRRPRCAVWALPRGVSEAPAVTSHYIRGRVNPPNPLQQTQERVILLSGPLANMEFRGDSTGLELNLCDRMLQNEDV
jgi:hypothetical protein